MNSFDETWADANPDATQSDGEAPPDGMYDVALVGADAFTSKAGKDVAKLEFRTVDGEHEWTMLMGFASTKAAGFSKGTCLKIGVNVDEVSSLDALGEALRGFVGGFYEVVVERNGDFVNTYVNDGAPSPSDVPAPEIEPANVGSTDDVPWNE